jgi:hypothetical protein
MAPRDPERSLHLVSVPLNQPDLSRAVASTKRYRNCEPLKVLGCGYEGVVHLVRDRDTTSKYVVKVFHTPRPKKTSLAGLQVYADRIPGTFGGLSHINCDELPDRSEGPVSLGRFRLMRYRSWMIPTPLITGCTAMEWLRSSCHCTSSISNRGCYTRMGTRSMIPADIAWTRGSTTWHGDTLGCARFWRRCAVNQPRPSTIRNSTDGLVRVCRTALRPRRCSFWQAGCCMQRDPCGWG